MNQEPPSSRYDDICQLILTPANPRPAGVWLVTRPAGGGGGAKGPPEISQTTGPISKFQTPFNSPVRELPVKGQKFDPEVTDNVTGQVKVRILNLSGLVTSASKISMLTRAPLGYFYNATHLGGGAISSSDLRNYWTDSKNSNGDESPGNLSRENKFY